MTALSAINIEKSKNSKILYIAYKTLVLSITCDSCSGKEEKMIKEEELVEILKVLGSVRNIEEYQINTKFGWRKHNSQN